jgi:hypothetical protein
MEDANLNENIADHTKVVDGFHGEDGYGQEGHHAAETEEMHLNPTYVIYVVVFFKLLIMSYTLTTKYTM